MTRRTATWRSASIHSPRELQLKGRHLDRTNAAAERVVAAMRSGATLHRTHRPSSTSWQLSNGLPLGIYAETRGDDHV